MKLKIDPGGLQDQTQAISSGATGSNSGDFQGGYRIKLRIVPERGLLDTI